ncbi:rhamnogalacturonate lyase family protein [Actinidia rufa]|uniref:Rhamnogalacturonate lyase family protein n=1 Tax=Actinidia rufa TaxID=165716 RepID=A0A7J0EWB0_9ERIC|nr:rhamnogalacturonate lyase family protein [Actinidia rufa]
MNSLDPILSPLVHLRILGCDGQWAGQCHLVHPSGYGDRYWDIVWDSLDPPGHLGGKYDVLEGTSFSVVLEDENQLELSFTRTWNSSQNGTGIPHFGIPKKIVHFEEVVDDKYGYSSDDKDNSIHWCICSNPPVGFWMITSRSHIRHGVLVYEPRREGPNIGEISIPDGSAAEFDTRIYDSAIGAGIFSNAVNVHVGNDPMHYRMFGIRMVADAYCDRCRMFLGWKYVEVPGIAIMVQPGRFILYQNKLLLWDGSQIVYATNTHKPVDNDSSGSSEESDNRS